MSTRLRAAISSRFVVLPALLAVAIAAWNVYISRHDDGILRGRVTLPDGSPVAGANVRMMEQNFTTNSERGSMLTDADGRFEFLQNRSHNVQLRADKPGLGRSKQHVVRLYFRAQNVTLDAPLVIVPGPTP